MSSEPMAVPANAMPPHEVAYRALIEEAYIHPIRSVFVVDDEYPSLDAVLKQLVADAMWQGKKDAASAVLELLAFCRQRSRPWLVDVHDGTNVLGDERLIPQLHQSDLIIMDYHLQENGGQEDALRLLRSLASNGHFNLVIVYTKGDGGQIRTPFWEIVEALTFREWTGRFDSTQIRSTEEAIQKWEDADSEIKARLTALVSREDYLMERGGGNTNVGRIMDALGILLRQVPEGVQIAAKDGYDWLLWQRHNQSQSRRSEKDLGNVTSTFSESVNWVRLNNLFVTVVNKRRKPAELEAGLLDALFLSGPSPFQLLMAKMRAQMDEKGSDAEAEVLKDEYLQAGWLTELTKAANQDRRGLLSVVVDRHWEALGHQLRADLDEYASKLVEFIGLRGDRQVISDYVRASVKGFQDKIDASVNTYNCTRPIYPTHLTTGHIFSIAEEGKEFPTYWVCLSPACDLVPGQKDSRGTGRFLRFIAVRLEKAQIATALRKATESTHVFIKVGSDLAAFTAYPDSNANANPVWEQMFAANQGVFEDSPTRMDVARISYDGNEDRLGMSSLTKATICAQLRYEYALNLLQRLGITLSRIGLDFKGKEPVVKAKPQPVEPVQHPSL